MNIFFAATSLQTLPAGHRFPMGKYELLRQRLAAELPELNLQLADPATDGELVLVHTPAYVQAVVRGELSAAALREIGFPWSEGMVERARRSVGATVSAARTAMQHGVAANLAGGTHHAYADKGSGFCVFNDVAVAARLMQAEAARTRKQALQVAVIDLDVHQGNGTAHIFRETLRCSRCLCMAPKISRFAKRQVTSTWSCLMAVPIKPIWRICKTRWSNWTNVAHQGWCFIWQVRIRTRVTAWVA